MLLEGENQEQPLLVFHSKFLHSLPQTYKERSLLPVILYISNNTNPLFSLSTESESSPTSFESSSTQPESSPTPSESNPTLFEIDRSDVNSNFNFGVSKSQEPKPMENNDQTLKKLATLDVGLAGEDPHKHLKEFHVICSTIRPQGILEDYIKMKAFPFFLNRAAKDWLYL
ncbi:hypothetical protein CR513_33485, partial [Mucuna pruriens]